VLFIDGKNDSDDGMFTGKKNREPNLEILEVEKGRMCQVGTRSIFMTSHFRDSTASCLDYPNLQNSEVEPRNAISFPSLSLL